MATHNDVEQQNAIKEQCKHLIQQQRLKEAMDMLTDLCSHGGTDAEAWYMLGSVNGMLGNIEAAGECCRRTIALKPDFWDAHVNLGHVLFNQGRHAEALAQYESVLKNRPRHAPALNALGNALIALGRRGEAIASYEAAISINPNLIEAYYNLANIQKVQKKYAEAEKNYQQAIRLNPRYAAAHSNLGAVLYVLGQTERGIEHIRHALELDPGLAMAYNELGRILCIEGDLSGASVALETAVRLNPDMTPAYYNLGTVRNRQGRPEAGMEMFSTALRLQPHRADIYSGLLMTMQYLTDYSQDDLFEEARNWGLRYSPEGRDSTPPVTDADPRRRLRVGYVSGDYNNHPVGYFIESVLTHHDRSRYEVYCYANGEDYDDLTRRLQERVDHWRVITEQPDAAVVDQIRRDGIDILIDLSGHTLKNRLTVFAHKPAPVQATWMGYFATTGVTAMDYIIADRFVIPPREERYYVEQVVRLPDSYLCFTPPRYAIDVSPPPALSTGRVTFGCFQNIAKMARSVGCWAKLMHAVPGAQLYLHNISLGDKGVQEWCAAQFAEHGIASQRIRMGGYVPRDELLAQYREVDIALDPFPYNGGTTTVEALWMGVPVISKRGDRFVSRVGDSILSTAGLEELVVDTEEAYVAKAAELAADLPRLAELRRGLRERLVASPLCNGPAFTRSLEAAYRGMWEAWCRQR